MANIMSEKVHAEEVILSEADARRSRDVVTLKSGRAYKVGDVLGKITTPGADWGKYALANNQTPATNGTQDAAGVLIADVDASEADAPGVALVRDCQVKGELLNYTASTSNANKAALHDDLQALGIVVRPRIATPSPPPPPPPGP
jgi:hypothetical protein